MSFFEPARTAILGNTALAGAAVGALKAMARTRALGRPSRAPRKDLICAPIDEMVYAGLRTRCAGQGSDVGRISAGLLAAITGYAELADGFDADALNLPAQMARAIEAPTVHPRLGTRIVTRIRVPRPVYAEIAARAVQHGCTDGQIAADLLAITTGQPWMVRHLDRMDILRMASDALFATVDDVIVPG